MLFFQRDVRCGGLIFYFSSVNHAEPYDIGLLCDKSLVDACIEGFHDPFTPGPCGRNRYRHVTTPLIIPDRILRFLNSLPVTAEPLEWIPAFRDALCVLFGDVDRVTVNVNVGCDLRNPETYRPELFIIHLTPQANEDGTVQVASDSGAESRSERLMEYLRENGFPVDTYHPPHVFNYSLGERAYLGTIFLWREKTNEPIAAETLHTVALLEQFFIFALTDLVARRQHSEPTDRTFLGALEGLFEATGLSRQEQRVIVLQLFGHSYKEIADVLNITMDGVKHHLKMIHKKTGARSYTELFAKYFMPRFDVRENDDDDESIAVPAKPGKDGSPIAATIALPRHALETYFLPETNLGERLRKFGEIVYGSVEDFARALKVAPSNLQKYFSGERNPGLAMLQRLHELGCNINALIGAEGFVFASNEAGQELGRKFQQGVDAPLGT